MDDNILNDTQFSEGWPPLATPKREVRRDELPPVPPPTASAGLSGFARRLGEAIRSPRRSLVRFGLLPSFLVLCGVISSWELRSQGSAWIVRADEWKQVRWTVGQGDWKRSDELENSRNAREAAWADGLGSLEIALGWFVGPALVGLAVAMRRRLPKTRASRSEIRHE